MRRERDVAGGAAGAGRPGGLEALARGVVHGTAGNMSIRDPETGLIAISPSGIPYPDVTPPTSSSSTTGRGGRRPAQAELRDAVAHHGHARQTRACGPSSIPIPTLLDRRLLHPALPAADPDRGLPGRRCAGAGHAVWPDRDAPISARAWSRSSTPESRGRHPEESWTDLLSATRSPRRSVSRRSSKRRPSVYVHALAANGGREPDLVPEGLIPEMTSGSEPPTGNVGRSV